MRSDSLFFILLLIIGVLLFSLLTIERKGLVDIWVLSGSWNQFILAVTVLALVPFVLHKRDSAYLTLFSSLILVALIVLMPLIKYSSPLYLYGTYDSLAHYSFSKWIANTGRIPTNGEVYYSLQYGYHAGNGILPAFLLLISGIPLDLSMDTLLIIGYWIYVIILYVLLPQALRNKPLIVMLLLSIPLYYPYYTGSSISYPFVALIIYAIYPLITKGSFPWAQYLLFIVSFIGLLGTHLSTTTILTFTLAFALSIIGFLCYKTRSSLLIFVITILSIYFAYELFVDYVLMKQQLPFTLNILQRLYSEELYHATQPKPYSLPLIYRVWNYVVTYPKEILLTLMLVFQILLLAYNILKVFFYKYGKDTLCVTKLYLVLGMLALMPLLISWSGVGKLFTASVRFLNVSQFSMILYLGLLLSTREYSTRLRETHIYSRILITTTLIILVAFNYMTNYGLTILMKPYPLGNELVYNTTQNGVITSVVLYSVYFINQFNTIAKLVVIQPLLPYGYADLAWNISKIPPYGHVSAGTQPEDVIETLKSSLRDRDEYLIPLPLEEDAVPSSLGYRSYFYKPFNWLLQEGGCIVYNNGFYSFILLNLVG